VRNAPQRAAALDRHAARRDARHHPADPKGGRGTGTVVHQAPVAGIAAHALLGQIREPSDEMLRRLTDIDYKNEMAFIALVHRDGQTQEIGVARYSTSADGKFCECAITVSDEWHYKGLATLLMHHLIDVARTRGIRTMVSYDAIDNGQMRELATFLGFKRKPDPADSGMVVHTLTL
jgi:GNAT superfamily N-acetyltransferase